MHKRLEKYLDEIAVRLGPLPAACRNDEIREMRQHLLNAMIVNQELGQPEDEAAVSAIEQCGPPEEAAQGLIRAWQRTEMLNKRRFWGAAICTLALMLLMELLGPYSPLSNQLVMLGLNGSDGGSQIGSHDVAAMMQYALVGGVCVLLFSRQALPGILLGVIVWTGFSWLISFTVSVSEHMAYMSHLWALRPVLSALAVILAAFLTSCRRGARLWRGIENTSDPKRT